MSLEHHDDSLTAAELDLLARFGDHDPSPGFADRVMSAWDDAEPSASPTFDRAGAARKATAIAIVSAVLAAAAVLAMWVRAHASARPTAATMVDAVAEADELRQKVRRVLGTHCAPCHDGRSPESDPAALRVFDVESERWYTTPDRDALPLFNDRLAEKDGATDPDRALVAAFVDDELRRRLGAG